MNLNDFFSKEWRFTKKISLPELLITGSASFKSDTQERKIFKEEGLSHECYQHYFYQIKEKSFSIFKFDNTLLHIFQITTYNFPITLTHSHLCNKDSYSCTFKIKDKNTFEIFYSIKGPQKNYTIETIYEKIPVLDKDK